MKREAPDVDGSAPEDRRAPTSPKVEEQIPPAGVIAKPVSPTTTWKSTGKRLACREPGEGTVKHEYITQCLEDLLDAQTSLCYWERQNVGRLPVGEHPRRPQEIERCLGNRRADIQNIKGKIIDAAFKNDHLGTLSASSDL